jgi:U3 small nucleolar RNA-associated protein 20
MVGPYFLHFIVREGKSHLRTGWESHILNYLVYSLVKSLDEMKIGNGSIDYCLPEILPLLIEEIFGRLKDEKALDIGKRIPELKKNKANECLCLLG